MKPARLGQKWLNSKSSRWFEPLTRRQASSRQCGAFASEDCFLAVNYGNQGLTPASAGQWSISGGLWFFGKFSDCERSEAMSDLPLKRAGR